MRPQGHLVLLPRPSRVIVFSPRSPRGRDRRADDPAGTFTASTSSDQVFTPVVHQYFARTSIHAHSTISLALAMRLCRSLVASATVSVVSASCRCTSRIRPAGAATKRRKGHSMEGCQNHTRPGTFADAPLCLPSRRLLCPVSLQKKKKITTGISQVCAPRA